jgi:iron complex transport system ATP-binding protein
MLEFKNIHMAFNNNVILENTQGCFHQGQIIAITGKNGVGKSTLLRILSGIQKPTKGSIYFFNKDLYTISLKRLADLRSYIPAERHCHWDLCIEDVISLGLINQQLPEKIKEEKISNVMKDLDLIKFKGRKIHSLSSGEKTMAFLARAIISNPDYLFADELLSNLHEENQHRVMHYLQILAQQGKCIVLVTHNMNIAKKYCDQIYNLEYKNDLSQENKYPEILAIS